MDFGLATYALGFVAGVASVLSPCVLPLIPILMAAALSGHRYGPLALAAGLALSFAVVGTLLAAFATAAGLDADTFRVVAAALMVLFGLVMLVPRLNAGFVALSSSVGGAGHRALGSVSGAGLGAQFCIGLLLGLVWSPCVGPTLGAATTLAAQGRDLGHIALLMVVFGLGAGLPLAVLGSMSRASLMRVRGSVAVFGKRAKAALGTLFILLGVLIMSGYDRNIEGALLAISPVWLTRLTTAL
jgi:cytochrome c biogenesis protein CcdA